VLAAVALGPALAPGFVLSYDMVFVPVPSFSWSQLGLGAELPRAVPLDALTAGLSVLVPAALLQKLLLLGAVVSAGCGAAALVPARCLLPRLAAATVAAWNPFVAERLVLGHWGLLIGYGALPWLVRAARRHGEGRGRLAPVLVLIAVCAVTPTGGLLSLVVVVTAGAAASTRHWRRTGLQLLGWLALNAPWWLPGLLHASAARSDDAAVSAFAARAEVAGGVLPTVLGLGGVWNAAVVPDSRTTPLALLALALLVTLAGAGAPLLWRRDRVLARTLLAMAAVGWAVALLGTTPPGRAVLGWLVADVPGAALLRDGQKFVALAVPLVAVLVGCGAERLGRLAPDLASRRAVMAALVLVQVALLPDLAWGAGGRLDAVSYPVAWSKVRAEVAADPARGDLLVLPWSAFRSYAWNGRRTVLDPAPRFFPRDSVVDDRLVVGRTVLAAEDPRSAAVGRALARHDLSADSLRRLGIRLVLVQADQPGRVPDLPGTVPVVRAKGLALLRVPGPVAASPGLVGGRTGQAVVVLADFLAAGVALGALGAVALAAVRRRRPGANAAGASTPLLGSAHDRR
jgi:hypothetical protein